jgi:hypothetical protein
MNAGFSYNIEPLWPNNYLDIACGPPEGLLDTEFLVVDDDDSIGTCLPTKFSASLKTNDETGLGV